MTADAVDCPSAYVVDGDSLRCGSARVRLFGIDAPELHGCPRSRVCVDGDDEASKRSLQSGPAAWSCPLSLRHVGGTN